LKWRYRFETSLRLQLLTGRIKLSLTGLDGLACRKRKGKAGVGLGANKKFKRENKNRPVEQSSKKPVPRLREVIEVRNK
jgi:hypothetical protein